MCNMCSLLLIVFFFKQKTAYEMRISDWSSDVCSSDLLLDRAADPAHHLLHDAQMVEDRHQAGEEDDHRQRRDGEAGAADLRPGERTEDEVRPRLRIAEQVRHATRHARDHGASDGHADPRSEEHTSELQCLMGNSYAVLCIE